MSKYLDDNGLSYFWSKLKAMFALKADSASGANGVATKAAGILYGAVDSTSTSTAFTATIPGVTSYYDGLTIILYNGVVTSATSFTININNLGALGSYSNMALGNQVTPTNPTRDTTIFNINYAMIFVYCSHIGGSNTAGWIGYRGYDANTNTIGYQLRTNNTVKKVTDRTRYYRMLFSSPDDTKWIPANTQYDNSATSSKTVNQRPINPFGEIVYLGSTTNYAADANMSASTVWQQYNLTLGYSFNTTGAALSLTTQTPVYLKCAPQSDGSAIMDSTTPIVQALPSTDDGKIYIWLGIAYSATQIEMTMNHPVYYYKDGAIRLWTNAAASAVPVSSVNGQTGTVVLDAEDVGALPDDTTYVSTVNGSSGAVTISVPTKTSDLTNDSGFISGITSSDVTTALGYTPYNSTNPSGYVNASGAAAAAPVQSVNGQTGTVSLSIPAAVSDLTNDQVYDLGTISPSSSGLFLMTDAQHSSIVAMWNRGMCAITFRDDSYQYWAIKQDIISVDGEPARAFTGTWGAIGVNGPIAGTVALGVFDIGTGGYWTGMFLKREEIDQYGVLSTVLSFGSTSSELPIMDGSANTGASDNYARADHVHPTDTSRQATLVSGTNIKTVGGTSLLGSGDIPLPTKTSDLTNDTGYTTLITVLESAATSMVLAVSDPTGTTSSCALIFPNGNPVTLTALLGHETTQGKVFILEPLNAGNTIFRVYNFEAGNMNGPVVMSCETDGYRYEAVLTDSGNGLGGTWTKTQIVTPSDIPTKTSDLTNDSGYITSAPVTSVNSKTGAVSLGASDVGALANTGGNVEGDVTLKAAAATNSPCLIFQRGTLSDNYNDWMIQDRGGYLYFDERGQGSSAWTNRVMFNTTGGVVATTFSGQLSGTIASSTTATTQASTDNSTKVATTAFVKSVLPTVPTNVSSFTNDAGYLTLADLPIWNGTVQ